MTRDMLRTVWYWALNVAIVGVVVWAFFWGKSLFDAKRELTKAKETIGTQASTIDAANTQIRTTNQANRELEKAHETIAADVAALGNSINQLRQQNRAAAERIKAAGAASPDYAIAQGIILEELAAEGERIARAADGHVADLINHRAQWPLSRESLDKDRRLLRTKP